MNIDLLAKEKLQERFQNTNEREMEQTMTDMFKTGPLVTAEKEEQKERNKRTILKYIDFVTDEKFKENID